MYIIEIVDGYGQHYKVAPKPIFDNFERAVAEARRRAQRLDGSKHAPKPIKNFERHPLLPQNAIAAFRYTWGFGGYVYVRGYIPEQEED